MLPNVANLRWCCFGLPGSGKSTLVRALLRSEPAHLVVDPMREHAGFNRYLPSSRQYSPESTSEFNLLVSRVIASGKVRLLVVDEASRYFPARRPLPEGMAELNDLARHYGLGLGLVARRPVQLHTDLVELAHYLFVFRLAGRNDLLFCDAVSSGLAAAVRSLPEYHFVVVAPSREFVVSAPVALR